MEPEGYLPLSQEPATYLYPQQDVPPTTHASNFHFNIISHLRLCLPNYLFPSGFSTKTLYAPLLSPIRATSPAYQPSDI
jgi:hypothetical protein